MVNLDDRKDVPNDVPLGSVTRRNPKTENVLIFPDAQDDTVDLVAHALVLFVRDPVTDQSVHDLFPDPVGNAFSQSQNPPSSPDVGRVLPRGSDR